MYTDVYTLKTPLDTLSWLCLLESELLNIRAFQRLDLHTERDEPNELTYPEEAIISAGLSVFSGTVTFHRCLPRPENCSAPLTVSGKKLTGLSGSRLWSADRMRPVVTKLLQPSK